MKRIAASLALVLAAACSSTPMTSSDTGAASSRGFSAVRLSNAPHVILLSAPTQVGDYDFSSTGIRALHLRGTMTNQGFIAAGPVQGNGKFCADGSDWYSLRELKVYRASENKTPVAPYITGCATEKGFQPASRDIVTQ